MKLLLNPYRDPSQDQYTAISEPLSVHRMLPGYAATALIDAPEIAQQLGIGRVSIKDEASRLGLPSFKILGASYAIYRALANRLGVQTVWPSLEAWRAALEPLRPCTLSTATDGNHGRAVAYMARILGLQSRIYVPQGMAQLRIDAIAAEGADVVQIHGSYDDAVALAAQQASERCLVIADTALHSADPVPGWVIDGYSTMFNEIDSQLQQHTIAQPDIVVVQIGVGALAAACVRHYRSLGSGVWGLGSGVENAGQADKQSAKQGSKQPAISAMQRHATQANVQPLIPKPSYARPFIIGVEPDQADCVLASLMAGQMISLPGVQHSIMAGLNCGTPSPLAWPIISTGLDLCVAVEDQWACDAMRVLAGAGIVSGESGAAGLAGILALVQHKSFHSLGMPSPLRSDSHMLLLSTEGATDPLAYSRIVQGDGVTG